MEVAWYLYPAFVAFVIAMLLVDLKFFHAEERDPSLKESGAWVAVWVGLAVLFGAILYFWQDDPDVVAEYSAGYLIEYSLSVDNMFVFVVIFSYFNIPRALQHQVLFYGILGAIIFRGLFIAIGVGLIERFEWMIYVFGGFLIYTAYKVATSSEEVHPEKNPVLKFFTRRFRTTTRFDGQKLFTVENGRRVATPLFVTLLFVETTDIVFAVDSIPAIFGITRDPFVILTSNVFAILGLRALYFLLTGVMDRFHLLKYGLAVILGFVGVKMLLTALPCHTEALFCEGGHVSVPIWLSLGFIVTVLAVTAVLSLVVSRPRARMEREGGRDAEPTAGVGSEPGSESGRQA